MRKGVLSVGIILLGIATFSSAAWEWYWVSCSGTYNMGTVGDADFVPCAISQSTGGGGSKIITHNNYYCLHFTEWRTSGNFRLHAVLYKGVNCQDWSPGDYCYQHPSDCDKYVDWGQTTVWLGDLSNYYISLNYGTTQWGPLVFSHGGSPLVNKMGFKIRVSADAKKRGGGKSVVVKQTNQLPTKPSIASAVKTATRKPRIR